MTFDARGNESNVSYSAEIMEELPSCGLDYSIRPIGQVASPAMMMRVTTLKGRMWTAEVFAPKSFSRLAISGLFSTFDPRTLLVISRGVAYLVPVYGPDGFNVLNIRGDVVGVRYAMAAQLVLLATDWEVVAIGPGSIVWTTIRLSIDGLRIDEIDGFSLRGVADPDSDEPRDFAIDLADGRVVGGAMSLVSQRPASESAPWWPILHLGGDHWAGLLDGDVLFVGNSTEALRQVDTTSPTALLPLLERPYSVVIADIVDGELAHGQRSGSFGHRIPWGSIVAHALDSGMDYWAFLALGWVESVSSNPEIVNALDSLQLARWASQKTRHEAQRCCRRLR